MRRRATYFFEPLECRSLLSGLVASLTTDQLVYAPGQPIQMTFTYTNTGNTLATFGYGNSFDGFNATQGGQTVWQSNSGANNALDMLGMLQPGQSFSLNATWGGTMTGASTLTTGSGTYVITNQLDPTGPSATIQINSQLSYSASFPQPVYSIGQPIVFSYTITNTSAQPDTFNLPATNFTVSNAEYGNLFWESNPGASTQPGTSETLQPGQSITQTATWNGLANEGVLVGTNVWGELNFSIPGMPAGSNQEFTIASPLAQSVASDQKTYAYGAPILFTATETNTTNQPVTILNTNDNFVVTNSTPFDVAATGGPANGSVVTLQPGQSQTFTATWNTGATDGSTPAPAGQYYLQFADNFEGNDFSSFTIKSPAQSTPPTTTTPPAGSSSPNPPQTPTVPTSGQNPPMFTATLTTNHATTRPGKPVRITIKLENIAKTTEPVTLDAVTDGIGVLHGSTVISRSPMSAKSKLVMPGKSIRLVTIWNGKPNQAGVTKMTPGMYTIEFNEGPYSASGQIRVV